MKNQRVKDILRDSSVGDKLEIDGWIRTRRDSGGVAFLEISDGSSLSPLQVVTDQKLENFSEEIKKLTTGCAVRVSGELVKSPAKGQKVELLATSVEVLGWADPTEYPLQKKRHSFEFLRSISHLRPRTNGLAAVARIRSEMNYAIHNFFRERGFFQVHTPIITTSDCEGAGEMFTVTALEPEQLSTKSSFEKDFFGKKASLTVSGQLQAEVYAMALGRVYTFGPTFRAENSNTSRHLAEFWMLEPEIAFCDLECNISLAQELIQELVRTVLSECSPEIDMLDRFVSKGLKKRLQAVVSDSFVTMEYTDVVNILMKVDEKFEYEVGWGIDLQAEHERYLCEEVIKGPVVVINYPRTIKPFYMRLNNDNKTVAAMDILVPGIGELVGGSQREERLDVLIDNMKLAGLDQNEYEWYLDLRRYGSVPHSGFGLGFERFIQFVTGMNNIREVIPFPRTPGVAAC